MLNILNINDWRNNLGLLPMNLFLKQPPKKKEFILLNGGNGDFCLDLSEGDKDYFSNSWSSNTNNFVRVGKENIEIYNWRKNNIEEIRTNFVEENFKKFYTYLNEKSIKSENDIVPFTLRIYRELRNLINDVKTGTESLNALFYLLAIYEEQKSIKDLNLEKWGLNNNIEFNINETEFEKYLNKFSSGYSENIKPNVELILRHASGMLFQEAHYEAVFFDKSLDLFTGTLSGNYSTNLLQYSSTHYTPSYIARAIVEQSLRNIDYVNKARIKIFDPACGTSEFLKESLKQLKNSGYKGKVDIFGWDTSEVAIITSKFLLAYEKREWGDNLTINLEKVEDSLSKQWDDDYDLILMNPPFSSWEQMNKQQKGFVRNSLDECFEKKPNQASAFFWNAIHSLSDNGIIGCVIPSSLLIYDSYKKLRKTLDEIYTPLLIGKLGNYIFDTVLTDVSIIIGKKIKQQKKQPQILWTDNIKGVAPDSLRDLRKLQYSNNIIVDRPDYSIYNPNEFPINKENWKPLSYKENKIFEKIEKAVLTGSLKRVQDIFNVKQGIRTGNNRVFKISKLIYNSLPDNERKYFRPAVDNDSIKKGQLFENNYVWYPYSENGIMFNSEKLLEKHIPFFYKNYLLPNKNILSTRSRKSIKNWWFLSEYRAWLTSKYPKLVSTEFGNSESFAFDDTGNFVVERGNAWIPKKKVENDDFYYFYLGIFSSPFFNTLLSIYSKQLSGGQWWYLSKNFTKNIPVPFITDEIKNLSNYEMLITLGKEISKGKLPDFNIINDYVKDYYLIDL